VVGQNILLLETIYDKFDLSQNTINANEYEDIKIINGPIEKVKMKQILKEDGFYFPIHFS
jgi:hypothetical protein